MRAGVSSSRSSRCARNSGVGRQRRRRRARPRGSRPRGPADTSWPMISIGKIGVRSSGPGGLHRARVERRERVARQVRQQVHPVRRDAVLGERELRLLGHARDPRPRRPPPRSRGRPRAGSRRAEDRGARHEQRRAGLRAAAPAVAASMPPSTSIGTSGPSSSRRRATLAVELSMYAWPPQPGLTVMQSTWSKSPRPGRHHLRRASPG